MSNDAFNWRYLARQSILAALEEAKALGLDEKQTRKHVSEKYPFGEREYYPYKAWLMERKLLLGGDKSKTSGIWQKLEEWKKLSE